METGIDVSVSMLHGVAVDMEHVKYGVNPALEFSGVDPVFEAPGALVLKLKCRV